MSIERLPAAIGVATLVHLIAGWGLMRLIARPDASLDAGSIAISILAGSAAFATLGFARRGDIDRTIQLAPAMFGLVPALLSLFVGVPWLELRDTTTLLAALTAPGLAIALTLEQVLWTLAARIREGETRRAEPGRGRRVGPPSLTGRLARLIGTLAVATFLLVFAYAIVHMDDPEAWLARPRTWLASLGAVASVALAVLAAMSAGLSPGRDVLSLARRLDAIGWDESLNADASTSAAARPLESPVRVTSFDAVGDLFASLERLRARLAEDVGTYQRALDRTHAADAAKREFLAAVSHELRTPLNSILGYAQLLLESELNESQAEDVRLILAGGRQLQELIEDILDLSMIESGELELRFATSDLDELIAGIVDIHQAQVRERDVELRCDLRGPIPAVVCDRKRIGQVVTNLLSNAIKFTEAGRVTVTVQADPRRGLVSVAIEDTGVGIAAEELDAIFEEYRQVGARKRKVRGTGLGLAIARRIAAAHGGRLHARSTLDQGSTFTLELPLEPPALDGDPPPGGGPP